MKSRRNVSSGQTVNHGSAMARPVYLHSGHSCQPAGTALRAKSRHSLRLSAYSAICATRSRATPRPRGADQRSASAGSSARHRARGPATAPASFFARGSSSALTSAIEARPPEAITGMLTSSASAMAASRFNPLSRPSRAISV